MLCGVWIKQQVCVQRASVAGICNEVAGCRVTRFGVNKASWRAVLNGLRLRSGLVGDVDGDGGALSAA